MNVESILKPVAGPWVYGTIIGAMAVWGIVLTLKEVSRLKDAKERLKSLSNRVKGHPAESKRDLLAEFAKDNRHDPLSHWILTAQNACEMQGEIDPSALTDGFWSREKERFGGVRFIGRNVILMGLLFTSVGLAYAVASIDLPASTEGIDANIFNKLKDDLRTTLRGMSTAFISSMLGLSANFILGLLSLLSFDRKQATYLEDADIFLQGTVIPAFAEATRGAEESRIERLFEKLTHRIGSAYDQLQGRFSGIEEAFNATRQAYDHQFERLGRISDQIEGISGKVDQTLSAFSSRVDVFTIGCNVFREAGDKLDSAYTAGLARLEQAQAHTDSLLSGGLEIFNEIHDANKGIADNLKATTQNYQEVSAKLVDIQSRMQQSFAANEGAMEALTKRLNEVTSSSVTALDSITQTLPPTVTQIQDLIGSLDTGFKAFQTNEGKVADSLSQAANAIAQQNESTQKTLAQSKEIFEQRLSQLLDGHLRRMDLAIDGVKASFDTHLAEVSDAATTRMAQTLPEAVNHIRDRFSILGTEFAYLVQAHKQTIEQLASLHQALSFDPDRLRQDLEQRQSYLNQALAGSVAELTKVLRHDLAEVHDAVRQAVQASVERNSEESFKYLREFSSTVATKYDHLIQAYSIAAKPQE